MYHVPLAVQCTYGCSREGGEMGMGKRIARFLENGRERRLSGLLYAYNLAPFGEPKEGLRVVMGWFAEM